MERLSSTSFPPSYAAWAARNRATGRRRVVSSTQFVAKVVVEAVVDGAAARSAYRHLTRRSASLYINVMVALPTSPQRVTRGPHGRICRATCQCTTLDDGGHVMTICDNHNAIERGYRCLTTIRLLPRPAPFRYAHIHYWARPAGDNYRRLTITHCLNPSTPPMLTIRMMACASLVTSVS